MSFAVIAELPLGAYRGSDPEGDLDVIPAPARLHAALLCAAASGPRAVRDGELLRPCDDDEAALVWLEEHPPDGVLIPRHRAVATSTIAYRNEGTIKSEGSGAARTPREKVVVRPLVGLVAVDGPFAWVWDDEPPVEVRGSLAALCPDVSHLGSSETPARLRVGEARATHHRVPDADLFTGRGLDLDVSTNGRTAALRRWYDRQAVVPPPREDRYSSNEEPRPGPVERRYRQPARYVPDEQPEPEAPWDTVLLARLRGDNGGPLRLAARDRVSWAVAVHRALVALVGYGAPSVLTGAYAPGVERPANRVAIQFLVGAPALAAGLDAEHTHLALMLPSAAQEVDAATVAEAFRRLTRLRGGGGSGARLTRVAPRSARTFWSAPPAGTRRVWVTDPAAVPDTRPVRGSAWTFEDTALLSLGFVLRDQWGLVPRRGGDWYRELAATARQAGAQVLSAARVTRGDLTDYVHKVQEGAVVQPYTATLTTGRTVDERSLVAIGQSRHLGGGLLVPDDVEAEAVP